MKSWWDWRADRSSVPEEEHRDMSDTDRSKAFNDLLERCLVLESLAPIVKPVTVSTALDQFGKVTGVKMMINPMDMKCVGVAIVEMENTEQRDGVVEEMTDFLFMLGAMPRPVQAMKATPQIMIDHPWRKNPNITRPRLIGKMDPRERGRLTELERRAKRKALDDVAYQRSMDREAEILEKSQVDFCKTEMIKHNIIEKFRESGTIVTMRQLHGLPEKL